MDESDLLAKKLEEMNQTYAPLIGKINMAWGDAQFWVYTIFFHLMGDDSFRSDPLFFSLRSDSAQRDINISLIDALLPHAADKNLATEAKSAINKLGSLAGDRNAVIHAMWSLTLEGEPKPFARSSPRLTGRPLKQALEKTHADILSLQQLLHGVSVRVKDSFPSLPSILRPRPN